MWIVEMEYAPNLGPTQIPRIEIFEIDASYVVEQQPPWLYQYLFEERANAEVYVQTLGYVLRYDREAQRVMRNLASRQSRRRAKARTDTLKAERAAQKTE